MELVEDVDFDADTGLVPAVVQSDDDGRVLMLAYMDRRALERTLQRGRVTFWSRSRRELWEKGATSGNWLEALEVRTDCDGDALLVRARAHGPACHTGERSCFDAGASSTASDRGDDGTDPAAPETTTGSRPDLSEAGRSPAPVLASVLEELVGVVARRDRERPDGSHTASLLEAGPEGAGRKVGEEAVETVLAAVDGPARLAEESADLLYHLVVLWRAAGLRPDAVGRELAERRSGPAGDDPTAGVGDGTSAGPEAGDGP